MSYVIERTYEVFFHTLRGEVKVLEHFKSDDTQITKFCTKDHWLGIKLESVWLNEKYHGFNIYSQGLTDLLINGKNTKCDIIHSSLPDGTSRSVIFDLSDFFYEDF